MKKLLIVLALAFSAFDMAKAAPYFSVLGQPGYTRQILSEACFRPDAGVGATSSCTSIPLVEHSARNGYILIPNEDWSPITVGGGFFTSGSPLFVIGPAANLAPMLKSGLLGLLNRTTQADSFSNLKSLLSPPLTMAQPDITINIGAKWGLLPGQRWKGLFILSVGPALSF